MFQQYRHAPCICEAAVGLTYCWGKQDSTVVWPPKEIYNQYPFLFNSGKGRFRLIWAKPVVCTQSVAVLDLSDPLQFLFYCCHVVLLPMTFSSFSTNMNKMPFTASSEQIPPCCFVVRIARLLRQVFFFKVIDVVTSVRLVLCNLSLNI